jgi:hypothetical protein
MNGGNCQRCAHSPWVQRANQFLNSNRRNVNYNAHVTTIEFLLQNGHCGINYRTTIEAIRQYLNQQNIQMSREGFQNQVLTELKRQGIVATLVYPGRQGGVFIPCGQDEVRQVAEQVIERVIQELTNLEGITCQTQIHDIITSLREAAESVMSRVQHE